MAQKTVGTEPRKRPSGRTITLPLGGGASVTIHVPRVDPFGISADGHKLLDAVLGLVNQFGSKVEKEPATKATAAPVEGEAP